MRGDNKVCVCVCGYEVEADETVILFVFILLYLSQETSLCFLLVYINIQTTVSVHTQPLLYYYWQQLAILSIVLNLHDFFSYCL